jgi:hypothetical protein
MIGVNCPGCGERMYVPDSLAGQPVSCPKCSLVVGIPNAAPVPPAVVPVAYASRRTKTAPFAVASLVCGILSIPGLAIFLSGLVLAILAIVFGELAGRAIKKTPDKYTGKGMATAGRLLGWICIAIVAALVITFVLFRLGVG